MRAKLHPPIHSPYLEPRLPQGRVFFVCCLIPAPGTVPSPLPALHKHLINCPFIYFPCRALWPARRPALQLPSLHRTRAALSAQGYGPQPRDYPAARGLPGLPFPGGRSGRRALGNPGPLPVGSGQAGRPRPSRPAACARGRRGRSTEDAAERGARGAGRGRPAARRAGGEGNPGLARRLRPRSVRGGARVKRAGAGPPGARRAESGREWGGGCGRGRFRAAGRGRAEEGGGPQKLLGARPAGGRADGLRAGGRSGPGLGKFARRLVSAGCGARRPLRARCHGFPQEDEKLPALQPGVRHPQPCGHRLLPGALRPHRADVRGERDWGGGALSRAPPVDPCRSPGSPSELGRGVARTLSAPPALYTVPPPWSPSQPRPSPPPPPRQLCALPAMPYFADPLGHPPSPAALSAALNPKPGLEPTAVLPPWPKQWGFLSGVREPSPETPRPGVIAQLTPSPKLRLPALLGFSSGRDPDPFHLPPAFLGLLPLHVWP